MFAIASIYTPPNLNPYHYHFLCIQNFQLPFSLPLPPSPSSMGGCVSRPKELGGPKYQSVQDDKPAVSPEPVEGEGNATAEEVKAETATEPETKDEPLVDVSEPQPEFSELTVSAPEAVESATAKEDAPIAEQVTVTEETVVEEKAEKAKESEVVADDDELEAKVSA